MNAICYNSKDDKEACLMNNTTHDNYHEYPEGGKRAGGSRSGGRRSSRRKKKQSRVVYYVILLVLLGVLVFSAIKIISYFKQQADASQQQQTLEEEYTTPVKDDNDPDNTGDNSDTVEPDPESITVDFDKLIADYPDVVGYIYCANTKIKYVIQHGKGNDYYLVHDSQGNTNNNGSIFIEELNSGSFSDGNTIIYGHNMKTGMMFAGLRNYHTDKNYYAAHPYMYIYTPSQNYKLELFAGFVCEHDDEIYSTSLTQAQLEAMAAKSDFKANIGVPTGKTVTLSTCSYEFADARYVVIGALTPIS